MLGLSPHKPSSAINGASSPGIDQFSELDSQVNVNDDGPAGTFTEAASDSVAPAQSVMGNTSPSHQPPDPKGQSTTLTASKLLASPKRTTEQKKEEVLIKLAITMVLHRSIPPNPSKGQRKQAALTSIAHPTIADNISAYLVTQTTDVVALTLRAQVIAQPVLVMPESTRRGVSRQMLRDAHELLMDVERVPDVVTAKSWWANARQTKLRGVLDQMLREDSKEQRAWDKFDRVVAQEQRRGL